MAPCKHAIPRHVGFSLPHIRIYYESLVASPATEIARIAEFLGSKASPAELSIFAADSIDIADNHMMSGNPHRLGREQVQLRLDDEWRTKMRSHRSDGRDASHVAARSRIRLSRRSKVAAGKERIEGSERVTAQRTSAASATVITYGTNLTASVLSLANVLIVSRALGPEGRGDVVFLAAMAFFTIAAR